MLGLHLFVWSWALRIPQSPAGPHLPSLSWRPWSLGPLSQICLLVAMGTLRKTESLQDEQVSEPWTLSGRQIKRERTCHWRRKRCSESRGMPADQSLRHGGMWQSPRAHCCRGKPGTSWSQASTWKFRGLRPACCLSLRTCLTEVRGQNPSECLGWGAARHCSRCPCTWPYPSHVWGRGLGDEQEAWRKWQEQCGPQGLCRAGLTWHDWRVRDSSSHMSKIHC